MRARSALWPNLSEEVQSAFSLFHILLDLLSMIMVGKSVMPSMTGTVIA